jgi:hypothetical protein
LGGRFYFGAAYLPDHHKETKIAGIAGVGVFIDAL